eukprot:GHVT01023319.1.p1 GENE.GHVT01023319.1~~GHVT01023319.1.p1  ORF type:complete len:100 (-),score=10.63 GHVT01023319.1:463-762(-)
MCTGRPSCPPRAANARPATAPNNSLWWAAPFFPALCRARRPAGRLRGRLISTRNSTAFVIVAFGRFVDELADRGKQVGRELRGVVDPPAESSLPTTVRG